MTLRFHRKGDVFLSTWHICWSVEGQNWVKVSGNSLVKTNKSPLLGFMLQNLTCISCVSWVLKTPGDYFDLQPCTSWQADKLTSWQADKLTRASCPGACLPVGALLQWKVAAGWIFGIAMELIACYTNKLSTWQNLLFQEEDEKTLRQARVCSGSKILASRFVCVIISFNLIPS